MPLIYMHDDLETKSPLAFALNLVLNHNKSIEEAAERYGIPSHEVDNALFDKIDSLPQNTAKRALYRVLAWRK